MPVNCISVDLTGEFIATCSDDGKVGRTVYGPSVAQNARLTMDGVRGDAQIFVGEIFSRKEQQTVQFNRPVKAVVLDPNYGKSKERRIICGGNDGRLLMLHRGLFGTQQQSTMYSGDGPIYAIKVA